MSAPPSSDRVLNVVQASACFFSNAVARAWYTAGVRSGDGIAILCRNHRGFLDACFASYKLGLRIVFMNTEFAGPQIDDVCKRAYRALNIKSYARFDLRVTAAGSVYVIEPNANPCIAKDDELAQSALKAGIAYPKLIRKVVNQALRRKA